MMDVTSLNKKKQFFPRWQTRPEPDGELTRFNARYFDPDQLLCIAIYFMPVFVFLSMPLKKVKKKGAQSAHPQPQQKLPAPLQMRPTPVTTNT
jgi:hypothetical protein